MVACVGSETWWIHYPSASGGMQSPIDIETEEIYHDAEFGRSPLEVHYHLQAAPGVGTADQEGVDELWTLVNTGWTLQVDITNSQSCKLLSFDLLTFYDTVDLQQITSDVVTRVRQWTPVGLKSLFSDSDWD